jgi:hypothetical protein
MTQEPSSCSETLTQIEIPIPPPPAEVHQTWQEFFAERDRLKAGKLEKETSKFKEAWLNRARKPPTVTASVFERVESDDDPSLLVHQPVTKNMREETLGYYSESQKKYNAFRNEWDCFEEFGPGEVDEDEWEPMYINQNQPCDPPTTI